MIPRRLPPSQSPQKMGSPIGAGFPLAILVMASAGHNVLRLETFREHRDRAEQQSDAQADADDPFADVEKGG